LQIGDQPHLLNARRLTILDGTSPRVYHKQTTAAEQELAETTLVAAALRAGGAMTHGTHMLQ
jgi:hypothetical protein